MGSVDIGEYLYDLKDQEVMLIVAPLGPVEELPIICALYGTPYSDDECPTRSGEREDAKKVIEERPRRDGQETDRLITELEEWLEEIDNVERTTQYLRRWPRQQGSAQVPFSRDACVQ